MIKHTLLLFLCPVLFFTESLFCQDVDATVDHQHIPMTAEHRKGQFYFYWGYNRAWFSTSDLSISGPLYDFTLLDIRAEDRPTPFSFGDYFSIKRISIPQFNYRLGFYLNDHFSLSIGHDHMKYVMVQDQVVEIDGNIENEASAEYGGTYSTYPVKLTSDFLKFEHTDGLNVVSFDFDYVFNLFRIFNDKLGVNINSGLGGGWMVPRSDVRIFGYGINNDYHVAGFAVTAKSGLEITAGKYIFIRSDLKTGYINMRQIFINNEAPERASQHFYFLESYTVAGAYFKF